eukprot:148616-Rhodomonas_salina.1
MIASQRATTVMQTQADLDTTRSVEVVALAELRSCDLRHFAPPYACFSTSGTVSGIAPYALPVQPARVAQDVLWQYLTSAAATPRNQMHY